MPDDQLDMTMMYAFHDALRRDLKQIEQMEGRSDGWDLFESLLHVHHTTEDDELWPLENRHSGCQLCSSAVMPQAEHRYPDPCCPA